MTAPDRRRDGLREAALAVDPFPPQGSPSDMATAWLTMNLPRLAALRALAEAAPPLPPGTRLILASENLLDVWGSRTEYGDRITAEWGEPRPEGWYEPTFTVHHEAAPLSGALDPRTWKEVEQRFWSAESKWADAGSGMTKDQQTGASMAFAWLQDPSGGGLRLATPEPTDDREAGR